ncbi:MAG TPA: HAD family hydrolase [Vicinamibacteria bacterium]|nr:HAD family hydrolase [Vicinamibacteria bacterium]
MRGAATLALDGRAIELDTVFLDAGGVLVNPNWDRVSGALRAQGVTAPPAALEAAEALAKRDLDTAELVTSTTDSGRAWRYMDLVLSHAGVARSGATDAALARLWAYHSRFNLWEVVPGDVRPALRRFRAAGLRLAVVSNSNGTVRVLFDRLGMTSLFDHVFDSQLEKLEKPDPRFFALALERCGSRAERTVHVGDLYHVDVVGARAAGVEAVLLDPAGLQAGADCPRVQTLLSLAERLRARP